MLQAPPVPAQTLGLVVAGLLAAALTTVAAGESVSFHSGNGSYYGLDSKITYTHLSDRNISASDYAAARSGAKPRIYRHSYWTDTVAGAQWVEITPRQGDNTYYLFAIDFNLSDPVGQAKLTITYSGDDVLGWGSTQAVHLNGQGLGGYKFSFNNGAKTESFDHAGPMLSTGQNTMYLFLNDSLHVAGAIFNTTVETQPPAAYNLNAGPIVINENEIATLAATLNVDAGSPFVFANDGSVTFTSGEPSPQVVAGSLSSAGGTSRTASAAITYLDDGDFIAAVTGSLTLDATVAPYLPETVDIDTTIDVQVLNLPPVINTAPADIYLDLGDMLLLDASATDPSPVDVLTYDWDLDGDGAYDDLMDTASGSWTYADPGVFAASLRVSDDDGGIATHDFTVTVAGVIPEPATGLISLALVGLVGRRRFHLIHRFRSPEETC